MKSYLHRYFRSNQNLIALPLTILAAVLLARVLFAAPYPSVLDNGSYVYYLDEFGLSYTAEDAATVDEHYYNYVIEDYAISRTPWGALLLVHPVHSLVYPVTAVKLLCQVLGVDFSTRYLAAVLCLMLLYGFYIFIKSLYVYLRSTAIVVGAMACAVLLCGNYVIYFNSLYPYGMFYVSGWLFAAAFLRVFALLRAGERRKSRLLLPLAAAGVLLVTSCELASLLCPVVIALVGLAIYRCVRAGMPKVRIYLLSLLLLAYASVAFLGGGQNHLFVQVNLYNSFFDGALQYSSDAEATVQQFGLDVSLAADAGKTYYEDASTFVIAPGSEEAGEAIFSHLSYFKIAGWYLTHPGALWRMLNDTLTASASVDSSMLHYVGMTRAECGVVTRGNEWATFRALFPRAVCSLWWVMMVGVLLYALWKRSIRGLVLLCAAVAGNVLLFSTVLAVGKSGAASYLMVFSYVFDALLLVYAAAGVRLLQKAYCSLLYPAFGNRKPLPELYGPEEYTVYTAESAAFRATVSAVKEQLRSIAADKHRFALASTCLAGVVLIAVLFFPRIGAYSNGDFGRMMDAMQLTYTAEDYYNISEQYSTKVIENYRFLEPYDWSQLRPSRAQLSQAYLSALARLLYSLTGMQFSTVTITVVYAIILLLCFYRYMRTAHRLCGQYAGLVGLTYVLLFYGSANLGWLNSLYGEAVGFVGLNAVIAASLRLLEAPHGRGGIGWLLYFCAVVLFIGGKAQYVVALPVLLFWTAALVVYHWPHGRVRRAATTIIGLCLCAFCIVQGVRVYSHNDEICSPDNLVNGLYNGILVVADDPVEALEELGLDTGMAADEGKTANEDPASYYCAPRTEMAEELIYSKVSSIDYLLWYLKHPTKLLYILNVAAEAARADMPDYFLYVGDRTDSPTRRTVEKLDLWKSVRQLFTPRYFVGYVLAYGVIFLYCLRELVRRRGTLLYRMGVGLFITVALCGILQYPLTVIGNGFSDNIKQLYMFREVWDGTLLVVAAWLVLHAKQLLSCAQKRVLHRNVKA